MPQFNVGGLVLGKTPVISSMQTGSASFIGSAGDVNITPVNPDNSVLVQGFTIIEYATQPWAITTELQAGSVIHLERNYSDSDSYIVPYTVIEYFPGIIKSNQIGSIFMSGADGTTNKIVAPVNPDKSICYHQGTRGLDDGEDEDMSSYMLFNNGSQVAATKDAIGPDAVANYQVIEFY